MTYEETINYLYNSVPMFQKVGASAYKEGLDNSHALDLHFNFPHKKYKTIHIAGTNGKGSCSHTLASILQDAGYKVGLYTSPHLKDFRERIRVNGKCIEKQYVIDFVESEKDFFEPLHPSFFELTTALAFKYFAEQDIDIAVIETGLGGRLDCTNIINPIVSMWCGKSDLNRHGNPIRPSNVRVYQFRHSRSVPYYKETFFYKQEEMIQIKRMSGRIDMPYRNR